MSDNTEDGNIVDFDKAKEKLVADAMKHANGKGEKKEKEPTQGQTLLQLAQAAELFHNADGVGYADLMINGHRETWPIRSKGFRRWLAKAYFEAKGGAPSSEAVQTTLNVIEAKAHFDAPERKVHIRVAGFDGRIYLDLCNETWQAVEIDGNGWRIIDSPPVRFRRNEASPDTQPRRAYRGVTLVP